MKSVTLESLLSKKKLTPNAYLPEWLKRLQSNAWQQLLDTGLPNPHHEDWRHCDTQTINQMQLAQKHERSTLTTHTKNEIEINQGTHIKIPKNLAHLKWGTVQDAWTHPFIKKALTQKIPANPYRLLNISMLNQISVVYIEPKTKIAQPIQIKLCTDANAPQINHTHIIFVIESESQVTLAISYEQTPTSHLTTSAFTYFLSPKAIVDCNITSHGPAKEKRIILPDFYLHGHNQLNLNYLTGEPHAIIDTAVHYVGAHNSATILGLNLGQKNGNTVHKLKINNKKPNNNSQQCFKYLLTDHAQATFNSVVHVHREAQNTISSQQNQNLILSKTAQIFSRPQLIIDNDQVNCTHGSSTGQLDEQALFYLMSRGLSETQARAMLIEGFAQDIIDRITNPVTKNVMQSALTAYIIKSL